MRRATGGGTTDAGGFGATVCTTIRALTELRRVLAPGARIVVHTVAPNPPASVVPPPVARRMRLYSDDELRALFGDAGFTEPNLARLGAAFQLVTASR